ncbi:MAG: di-trans,poly-cis-decaprenylcistransferase [Clostridia bacterium]|nr:di-trans,poly-cis-decaprenylcistransferase [Clostridia bacterium]
MTLSGEQVTNIPRHVGIIMDGNGRWAKKRLLPRNAGHKAGVERMEELARHAQDLGVEYFTVYALSTENMSRSKEELDGLYSLIRSYFGKSIQELYKRHAAVRILGDMSPLPADIAAKLYDAEVNSPKDATFHFQFAINYGGRAEILQAVNAAALQAHRDALEGRLPARYTDESFHDLLYTHGVPDVDLIIRTGGEKRISNFLLYQAAYAELYFTDVLFPDFTCGELDKALLDFSKRDRRYGKIKSGE